MLVLGTALTPVKDPLHSGKLQNTEPCVTTHDESPRSTGSIKKNNKVNKHYTTSGSKYLAFLRNAAHRPLAVGSCIKNWTNSFHFLFSRQYRSQTHRVDYLQVSGKKSYGCCTCARHLLSLLKSHIGCKCNTALNVISFPLFR